MTQATCNLGYGGHLLSMWPYSKNPVLHWAFDKKKPEHVRLEVLAKAAALKRKRDSDASHVMKEIMEEKRETLAKTARLKAARLALPVKAIPPKKTTRAP